MLNKELFLVFNPIGSIIIRKSSDHKILKAILLTIIKDETITKTVL